MLYKMIQMKYLDKNGSEWSIENGDWVGSFNKDEKNLVKNHPVKFSIFLFLILTLSVILLN
ncbi:MAG TPA: hypothetical protein VLN45_04640 [Ignavibacteriaceae bacterium]|nr:hypothetical protein [Ignavibacteriaceae bacterium]